MFKYNIIYILLFLIILCLLYTLLKDCGFKDGFSVGAQLIDISTIKLMNSYCRYSYLPAPHPPPSNSDDIIHIS